MRLQHVSIPIAAGGENEARAFYGALLGLEERDVPPHLPPGNFIWFRLGDPDLELHLIVGGARFDGGHHFCIELRELQELRDRLEAAGLETREATPIVGRPRFFVRDPFGNLIELARIDS